MAIGRCGSHAAVCVVGTAALGLTLGLAGCTGEELRSPGAPDQEEHVEEAESALSDALAEGKRLFDEETFGGNGRTCLTCHGKKTGTLNPEQVQELHEEDPDNPLFLHDGSDDFQDNGTTRIQADATILVSLDLPPNVEVVGNPAQRAIVVRRGIPTVMNTPALDEVLMLDGRKSSLTDQADAAIAGHAQATMLPTQEELGLIADFEKTARRFFSSRALRNYAVHGGPPPGLPAGKSPAQKRGRKWFTDAPADPTLSSASPRDGLCVLCHSGPLLNQTNAALAAAQLPFSAPAGTRFRSALVSELNTAQNPVVDLLIRRPDGTTFTASTPDPGRAAITGQFRTTRFGLLASFKIPQLRGLKHTAPYFHDNSAKTLEDVVDHYAMFFALMSAPEVDGDDALVMTAQDKADLVAYLKLL
jgi:cytochrome c peroxidase